MTTLRYSGGANINDGSGGRGGGGGGGGRGHFTGKNAARGRGRGVSSGSSNNRSYTRWARATAPVDDSAAATGGGAALASHSWIRPKAKDESPTSSGSTTNYGNAAQNPAAAVASTSSAVVHEQHQLATNHNNSNDINNRLDSKQQSEDAAITKSAPRSQQQSTPFPAPLTSIGGTGDDSEKNSRLHSSSMETTTTATTLAPPEKAATDKQDIDATVGEITATATTATTGPILKGPKKYSYIKPSSSQSAPTSSSSYSRKRGLTAGAAGQLAPNLHQHHSGTSTGTSSNIRQVGAKRASPYSNNINSSSNSFSWKRAEGKSSSTAAAAPTSTEHVAIAASSKKPPPPPPPAGAVPAFSQELAGQQHQQDSTTAQIAHDKASATNPLRKVGAYKLVHKKDNEETHNTVRKTSPTKRTAGLDNGSSSSNSYHRKKPPPPPPHHSTLQQQKRAAAVAASIRGAKRIKITSAAVPVGTDGTAAAAVEEEEEEEQRQAENDGEGVGGDDNDTHTRQERKGHGRRHKRSHRHGPTTSANNTLVRLQPDVATTPICPTFLRGLPCTEERCLQRHDIPKEFAMPVCSYFQKHGMCMKGSDCPFRHVKLSSLNLVPCPSFSILGYCPDLNCRMMHTRTKRTMIVNNSGNKEKQRTATTASTMAAPLPKDDGNDNDNDVENSTDDDDESDDDLVFYDD